MARIDRDDEKEVANIRQAISEARALLGMLEKPQRVRHSIDELLEQTDNIRLALTGQY